MRFLLAVLLLAGCSLGSDSSKSEPVYPRVEPVQPVPPPIDLQPQLEPIPDFNVAASKFKLTVYSCKEGCEPCDRFKRFFRKNRNRMPCEVLLMEYKNRDEVEKAGIAVPLFILADANGVEVNRWDGWRRSHGAGLDCLCENCFHAKIMQAMQPKAQPQFRALPPQQQPVRGGRVAAIQARSQITTALAWIRSNIGEGVPMEARWDRTGEQEFAVYGGDANLSLETACGQFGRFRLRAPGCRLPVDHLEAIYDIDGDHVRLQGNVEFDFGAKAPMARDGPVGSLSGLLTIFSVIKSVWGIWHTTIALTLGGNVQAVAVLQGDVLTIDVKKGLGAKIESAVSGKATVHKIQVSPTQVTVFFSGNRWIERFYPQQTFAIE